jgi:hypothetical protein
LAHGADAMQEEEDMEEKEEKEKKNTVKCGYDGQPEKSERDREKVPKMWLRQATVTRPFTPSTHTRLFT